MVAKVVKAAQGHVPVMLETTAAVHPGGSGGAVVNSSGHMIGLVTRYKESCCANASSCGLFYLDC